MFALVAYFAIKIRQGGNGRMKKTTIEISKEQRYIVDHGPLIVKSRKHLATSDITGKTDGETADIITNAIIAELIKIKKARNPGGENPT